MGNLKAILSKLAPTLGTLIGGPLGGAVVSILAETFGVQDDPDIVTAALQSSDPEVIKANLSRAEAAFRAEAEKAVTVGKQIDAHVELVRMDQDRGWFYTGWRPLSGWVAMIYSGATCGLVVMEGLNGSYGFLAQAPSVLMIGGPIMALAGVYAWQKSEETKVKAAGSVASIGATIRQAIGRG